MIGLDLVTASVQINGKSVQYANLSLQQSFNQHHVAEVYIDYEELDSNWMENPTSLIKLIGEEAVITFSHRKTSVSNSFTGIITDISAVGSHGEQGQYIIKVKSPTILLDGARNMDSFVEKPFPKIIDEIVSNSGNGAKVKVSPQYQSKLPYFCQYRESGFEVLNRLSWLYNESFYYDGSEILFGAPESPGEFSLTYGVDLIDFNFSTHLGPSDFTRYAYLDHKHLEKRIPAPKSVGEDGYTVIAKNRSEAIYNSDSRHPVLAVTDSTSDVEKLIDEDKRKAITGMVSFSGTANTCKVKLGEIARISLHKGMRAGTKSIGEYVITQVIHIINQEGRYENRFVGVPAGFKGYSFAGESTLPIAMPEIATVTENNKGTGHVKVKFKWHEINGKETGWIRVQSPDAGVSGDVPENRGLVFIPETDDQVMIHFIDGDPSRPYVNGSMFEHEKGKGGENDNQQKSITTRSGIKIVFNDDDKSLLIEDPSGNSCLLDGEGNINITAPGKITMTATEISINGSDLVHTESDKMIKNISAAQIETTAESSLSLKGTSELSLNSGAVIKEEAPKVSIEGSSFELQGSMIDIKGTMTNITGKPLNLN